MSAKGASDDPLGARDRQFLERRRSLNRFGNLALWGGLVLVLVAWVAFHVLFPLLVNPYALLGRLESKALETGSVTTLAMVGQLALNLVFLMLTALCAFTLGWAWQERRYLRIVDKLSRAVRIPSQEATAAVPTGPSPARPSSVEAGTPAARPAGPAARPAGPAAQPATPPAQPATPPAQPATPAAEAATPPAQDAGSSPQGPPPKGAPRG
jgi:hypothetical protein